MAYQVLARKYRPKNFGELVGQDHATRALINGIDSGRLHHAYLLTGTRGVGKTTIARILAKCLNCKTGITSTPCGVCDACVGVDDGSFLDLIEIDAASRTKVEDTRELLENVPYAPVMGRIKVYLIDEVHMLSASSFNALLKTLEEPPPHAKFILATTDPQKLPITIVSRCLQFVLRPLPQETLARHLAGILTQEKIAFEDGALWQLAQSAKGSVRDALSLTDQAVAFGGGQIKADTVKQMLGLIDGAQVFELIDAIHAGDGRKLSAQIQDLRQTLIDAPMVLEHLADVLHQVALHQVLAGESDPAVQLLAQKIAPEMVQLYYEIVLKAKDALRLSTSPMQTLEMTLLRLFAFRPLPNNNWSSSLLDDTKPLLGLQTNAADPKPMQGFETPNTQKTTERLPSEEPAKDVSLYASTTQNKAQEHSNTVMQDGLVGCEATPEQQDNEEPLLTCADCDDAYCVSEKSDWQPAIRSDFTFIKSDAGEAQLWTPAAWDEWVHEARKQNLIFADEFALASHATITGHVGGKATLVVNDVNYQTEKSFDGLRQKLNDSTKTELSLSQGMSDATQTPKAFENARREALLQQIEEQFLACEVMGVLKSEDFLLQEGLCLGGLRLIE